MSEDKVTIAIMTEHGPLDLGEFSKALPKLLEIAAGGLWNCEHLDTDMTMSLVKEFVRVGEEFCQSS